MSFNKCPPEVICEIFSHLLDVGCKIRLECVSKKFRDCIRNEDSWKRNSTLEITRIESDEELRSFLGHAKQITTLSFTDYGYRPSLKMVATLWEFEDKLKIDRLHIDIASRLIGRPNNDQLIACCFGKFHKSIKGIHLSCSEDTCEEFVALLSPRCTNLKHLTIRPKPLTRFFFEEEDEDGNNSIIRELANLNLNLETLRLTDFKFFIDERSLAAVFNSAREHSMRLVHIESTRDEPILRFAFDQFCRQLEAPAAEAITRINLLDVSDTNWADVFNTLPTKMPNLSRMTVDEYLDCEEPDDACGTVASKYASAMEEFLHDCPKRHNRIDVQLTLFGCPNFLKSLWGSINRIQVKQSGTKRCKGGNGWKRTLTNHCATIELDIRPSDTY